MRILHADDSALIRAMVQRILKRENMEVVSVPRGSDALEAAREGGYDGLITDIMMPEMTGVELVTELRRDPRTALLPILVCSTVSQREMIEEVVKAGVQDFITKPIDGAVLVDRLKRIVRVSQESLVDDPVAAMEKLGIGTDVADYAGLLNDFVVEMGETLGEIVQALDGDDASLVPTYATRIQGAAGSLGITSVAYSAATLAREAEAGNTDEIRKLTALLHAYSARISVYADGLVREAGRP